MITQLPRTTTQGPIYKRTGWKADVFRAGGHVPPLLLRYGNISTYSKWLEKVVAAYQEIGLSVDGGEFEKEFFELCFNSLIYVPPLLVLCGLEADVLVIQEATGMSDFEAGVNPKFWQHCAQGT